MKKINGMAKGGTHEDIIDFCRGMDGQDPPKYGRESCGRKFRNERGFPKPG